MFSFWFMIISIFFISSNVVAKKVEKTGIDVKALSYEIPCGNSNGIETFEESKIVGGKVAQPHEFPWLVSIQVKIKKIYKHNCGAAVIHSQFLITAGHCVHGVSIDQMRIAAGKFDLYETESTEQFRYIKRINSDLYNEDTFENDIALIQLKEPLDLNQSAVAPICIPTGGEQVYDKAIVAGWGRLKENGNLPHKLMKVMLPFIDTKYCKEVYTKKGYEVFLHDCQICTLDNNKKDACQGDSGGPLICGDIKNNNKLFICGIVSFGLGCAQKNFPGIYTNVTCFTEWITNDIEKYKY